MSEKIISSFQERRQLAQSIANLSQTESEQGLLEAVRGIALGHSPELVLAALVKNLDTPNSQIRGGLGHLATLLSQEEIVPALRSAAANRQFPAQGRVTAALILDRFLGEPVPAAALNDLNQTNEVAFQSLREAVDEGRRNRHVLLEYVTQMRQTEPEIAFMILNLMERLPQSDRGELYRLIAQDDRESVAKEALTRLEQLAPSPEGFQALRALYTLQFTLMPALATRAERAVRKLRFAGNRLEIPPTTNWRAFISPADTAGNQSIWFSNIPIPGRLTGAVLGMVVNSRSGILHAFCSENIGHEDVPRSPGVGQLVTVSTDNGESIVLLEIPFDFGRWRVQTALSSHWGLASPRPLPGEYRLYNDLIWQFEPPSVDADLAAIFVPDTDRSGSPYSDEELEMMTAKLFMHPVMSGWEFHVRGDPQTSNPANPLDSELPTREFIALIMRELEKRSEGEKFSAAMAQGLQSQAAWLHVSGSPDLATYAQILATQIASRPPSKNPVLTHMIQASLHQTSKGNKSL